MKPLEGLIFKMMQFDWWAIAPFIGMTGKIPSFSYARLIETFIIAGITMWGTVQMQATKLDAIAKVTDEMRQEVTNIRLDRAGRVKWLDAQIEAQIEWNRRQDDELKRLARGPRN